MSPTNSLHMQLSEEIDRLMGVAYAIHKRLGEAYDSQADQLDDMVKLGRLADNIKQLRRARLILEEPETLYTAIRPKRAP